MGSRYDNFVRGFLSLFAISKPELKHRRAYSVARCVTRAADLIRQSGEYLEDFNAAVDTLQKKAGRVPG